MARSSFLAPILVAVFPVLFLYAHNVNEVTLASVTPLVLAAVFVSLVLTLLLWLIFRDGDQASFVATLWILLFFLYGHIYEQINGIGSVGASVGTHEVLLPLVLAIALLPLLPALQMRQRGIRVMPYATVTLMALVAFNLVTIGSSELRRIDQVSIERGSIEGMVPARITTTYRPDIYYIVPDRYPRNSTLKEYYSYDNTAFTEYLEESGFYVADESFANYPATVLSLASSLNMEYLDRLSEQVGENTGDHTPAHTLLEDYRVWRILKEQYGYKFIHFGSWWEPTTSNPHADVEVARFPRLLGLVELDSFAQLLLRTTALRPFQSALLQRDTFLQREAEVERCQDIEINATRHPNNQAEAQCHYTLYTFQQLREMPRVEGPKFVFVHLLVPHPPFIFGPNGELVDPPPFYYWSDLSKEQEEILNKRRLDQIAFTNLKLQETIDHLLAESDQPPVIIVQAEEGPWTSEYLQREDEPLEWSSETFHIRFHILNAYYLPGDASEALYPSITPVNTFRVIFNEYFGADFPLLEDRAYVSAGPDQVYKFLDVTDRVKDEESNAEG